MTYPTANGVTYSADGGTKCYAEFGVTMADDGKIRWQTCIFEGKLRNTSVYDNLLITLFSTNI